MNRIHKLQKKQSAFLNKKLKTRKTFLELRNNIESVRIDPTHLRSILFYSSPQYIRLGETKECTFYSLLDNQLLRDVSGPLRTIGIVFRTRNKKQYSAVVPVRDFVNYQNQNNCKKNDELRELFSNKNLVKTMNSLDFRPPKSNLECEGKHSYWLENPMIPYLCKIPELIQKAEKGKRRVNKISKQKLQGQRRYARLQRQSKFYQKNLDPQHIAYLKNFCSNTSSAANFCDPYIAEDVWTKVINKEVKDYKMNQICKALKGGKESLSKKEILGCADVLRNRPDRCTSFPNSIFPSLYPAPNCPEISEALKVSKLYSPYLDCPGQIYNEGITNISRILSHFHKSKFEGRPKTCQFNTNYIFAKLKIDFNEETGWPLKICSNDQVSEEKKCRPYVPGHHPKEPLSEEKVVETVVRELLGLPLGNQCKLLDIKKFNPASITFRTGCFIIYSKKSCPNYHCPKKVIYNNKKIENIWYEGINNFEYFPTLSSKSTFSISNILFKTYKFKSKIIDNYTSLMVFLKNEPQGIIHGIGCVEDLLPQFFNTNSLNKCTPHPFIIDGFLEKDENKWVSLRSPVDNVALPRLISWNFLYSAVSNYKTLHPLQSWNLYGIK